MTPSPAKLLICVCLLTAFHTAHAETPSRPNIILLFVDDVGYGDLGCYGAKDPTPEIDRLASEGLLSTDCLVAANVCGPSRAAMLTGRYPMRCGHPISRHNTTKYAEYGIESDELTIAELLKESGYYNKAVGKWHLGFHVDGSHPLDAGFDEYLGLHSNYSKQIEHADTLYRNREIQEEHVAFEKVTRLYTDEVVDFIKQEHEQPFFIYFAHHIAHSPILPSESFRGASGKKGRAGLYRDFLLELDHSVGRVVDAVQDAGISENTLIVLMSDNGPAVNGSARPLSGGKYVTMEGGHRVPAIFYWPGQIPAGTVSNAMITSMDLLPLFCHFTGTPLPSDRTIDGRDISRLIRGESNESPHQTFYYYNGLNLQAIRKDNWKLHLPRTIADQPYWAKRAGGNHMKIHLSVKQPMLFELDSDIAEKRNLYPQHPEVASGMMRKADQMRAEIGGLNVVGSDQRPHNLINPHEKF
ncbi:sulfatase family protein [Rhodopirellula sallentina]|uniref:Arylsulfatase A n=1 Tax=Rhodopirellula sallentina SM41 TaxID=1263870 RepID=M5TSZ8_9BACT|nr:sulfatase [Rhodopirellula sallentina]EMI52280.1 arylsulfatase A [Rhodopirellula sallentina SM41]